MSVQSKQRPIVVAKYGGTSLATPKGWRQVTRRVRAAIVEGSTPVVVLSAAAGVTNALLALVEAFESDQDCDASIRKISGVYRNLATGMGLDARWMGALVEAMIDSAMRRVARGEESTDAIVALGEVFSGAFALALCRSRGIPAQRRSSRRCLIRSNAGDQRVCLGEFSVPDEPSAIIVEGFSVGTPSGRVGLLGRGGSDQTATLLAALLGARRCEIWTDVPGFFSADPRVVPTSLHYPALTYAAARLLAANGARVLQEEAIEPAESASMPIEIRSTLEPGAGATVVSTRGVGTDRVRAIGKTPNGISVLGTLPTPGVVLPHERVHPIESGFRIVGDCAETDRRIRWLHDRLIGERETTGLNRGERRLMPPATDVATSAVAT